MADIQRGTTFTTSIPDAATLHLLADNATILPTFISSKTVGSPASGDSFVYVTASGALRRVTLSGLVSAFPNGGDAGTFALRKLGTTSTTAAAGNDARFPARITGIRMGNGNSPDTVATAKNLSLTGIPISGTVIDWDAGNVFSDSLSGNKTYTFANPRNGRDITVVIRLNGNTVTMPSMAVGTLQKVGSGTLVETYRFTQTPLGITGYAVKQ